MADLNRNEKSSLVGKKSTKYGTAATKSTTVTNDDAFFKHIPKPGETLQGIALKYEVSVRKF